MTRRILISLAAAASLIGVAPPAFAARDQVWAVGSSTVFPFSTRVAEYFSRKTGRKAPRVESLGTGGGIKLFCSGVGGSTPDIANASRAMKKSEFEDCARHGVRDIIELKFGYDGIVIATARNGADFDFKLQHIYLALAKDVLRHRRFVRNPYRTWPEIDRILPKGRILVYGPPPTSGTRDAFVELAMEAGARKFGTLDDLRDKDEDAFKARATTLREDGLWVDSGENDNAILQTLTKTPGALGVFGFSFLEENNDRVKAAKINGVAPSIDAIANGDYPLSRSLYIYVKKAHIGVTPGLREFVVEFTSDAAAGRGGYLIQRGLIPLPKEQHTAVKTAARALTPMASPKK
jgi:phosphate transport system substrate-binding protein